MLHIVTNLLLVVLTPPFENLPLPYYLPLPLKGIFSLPLPFGDFWEGSTPPPLKKGGSHYEGSLTFQIIKDIIHLIISYSVVIETLKTVDPSRKCFRMVGGILSERTVKEVLPALINNKTQVN